MRALARLVADVMLWAAFALLGMAIIEAIANAFRYTVLRGAYTKGRLLEFAALLLAFVVALTLRRIAAELKPRSG